MWGDPEEPASGGVLGREGHWPGGPHGQQQQQQQQQSAIATKSWGLGRWAPKGPPGREGPYSHPPAHAGARLGCQRLLGQLELGVWGVKTVLAS